MSTPNASKGPNPLSVGWSVIRALVSVKRPQPHDDSTAVVDHTALASILECIKSEGVASLPDQRGSLADYRSDLESVDPDTLGETEALAYWLNLYNTGALDLAADAFASGSISVLRLPGGFKRPWATVAGETLSLDAIEHAKIRRFKDPRVHGALVCGSASCPTLRYEPYVGDILSDQLDHQMRDFFAGGGVVVDGSTVLLSRILLWFGGDFVHPTRMPSFVPVTKSAVAAAVASWLPGEAKRLITSGGAAVDFQPYDWSLACSIR